MWWVIEEGSPKFQNLALDADTFGLICPGLEISVSEAEVNGILFSVSTTYKIV